MFRVSSELSFSEWGREVVHRGGVRTHCAELRVSNTCNRLPRPCLLSVTSEKTE